eukprot:TRINITY_DN992_c0_g1_i1.p1 TRINITY_DN992_c0_g1~~TRINITY_DN992_c0_g1_i1.p1  ORF type:complete len:125 (-),score=25.54 TRINITY_DN992_c0_g1_i1:93-467(-)
MEGIYKVKGFTKNASDGNKTDLNNMVLYLRDGKVSATGHYGSGTNYNSAKATVWTGKYRDDVIEWSEVYGTDSENPFIYHGFISATKLWGTYHWTYNSAIGVFEFDLERVEGGESSSSSGTWYQ